MPAIDQRSALDVLTKPRLLQIAGALELGLPGRWRKTELVGAIAASARAPFPRILTLLRRDELKAICRAATIDDSGRTKAVIADRILRGRTEGVGTLRKVDLAEAVAAANGLSKQDAAVIVDAVLESIIEVLHSGEKIELRGFGSFRLRHRRARVGRNPTTGVRFNVPAKRVCYFKPGKVLRDL